MTTRAQGVGLDPGTRRLKSSSYAVPVHTPICNVSVEAGGSFSVTQVHVGS